jgi:hypothetical protein
VLERNREVVYVKRGEKTSFLVMEKEVSTPSWGGQIKAKFEVTENGQTVTVSPPVFVGRGSEVYYPKTYRYNAVTAGLSLVYINDLVHAEQITPFEMQPFKAQPDGALKPVVFMSRRRSDVTETYEVSVEYVSNIMGRILGKERISFTYQQPKDK